MQITWLYKPIHMQVIWHWEIHMLTMSHDTINNEFICTSRYITFRSHDISLTVHMTMKFLHTSLWMNHLFSWSHTEHRSWSDYLFPPVLVWLVSSLFLTFLWSCWQYRRWVFTFYYIGFFSPSSGNCRCENFLEVN